MGVPNQREQLLMGDEAGEANAFAAAPNALKEPGRFAGNEAFALTYDDEILRYPFLNFEECLDQTAEVFIRLDVSDLNDGSPSVRLRQLRGVGPLG